MRNEALGLWNIGEDRFHTRLDAAEAKRIIKAAYRSGITTFDSAYSYLDADTILYSALNELKTERKSWRIIEKVMPSPSLERKVSSIQKRLHTSFLDILLIHWPSDVETLYPSLKTLEKLKDDGTAKEIGVSNFPSYLLNQVSKDFPISYHERPLSLVWNRDWEEERTTEIKTLAYAPFGFGGLTEKKSKLSTIFPTSATREELSSILKRMAEEKKCSVYSIALSWVYSQNPFMIIRGVSNPRQIDIPLITLNEDEKKTLDNLSSLISAEIPGDNIFNHRWNKDAETKNNS